MIMPLTPLGQIVEEPGSNLIQVAANRWRVVGQNDSLLHSVMRLVAENQLIDLLRIQIQTARVYKRSRQ